MMSQGGQGGRRAEQSGSPVGPDLRSVVRATCVQQRAGACVRMCVCVYDGRDDMLWYFLQFYVPLARASALSAPASRPLSVFR